MRIERVRTDPDPYEPFLLSQAIRVGGMLFVSGQAGYGDDGEIVAGGFDRQAAQAFANLKRTLVAGGASLADVVKVPSAPADARYAVRGRPRSSPDREMSTSWS